jgi:hypothetical protein
VRDLRLFSQPLLALWDEWFATVETKRVWRLGPPVGEGESGAHWAEEVVSGGVGVIKPGLARSKDAHFRAAREKLAFDLAHCLRLPVPPVVLYRPGMPRDYRTGRAISAKAFPFTSTWLSLRGRGLLTDEYKAGARAAVSAMAAFHAWISQEDWLIEKTLVDWDDLAARQGRTPPALAFVDHAFAFDHVWKDDCDASAPRQRLTDAALDRHALALTIDQIAEIPDDEIMRLVGRIPEFYLPDAAVRARIAANLLLRRDHLARICATALGAADESASVAPRGLLTFADTLSP